MSDMSSLSPDELVARNRDLNLLRKISLIMQSSVDPVELQEAILRGLVDEMGYPQATIALYDDKLKALTSWLTLTKAASGETATKPMAQLAHTDVVLLEQDHSLLAQALHEQRIIEVQDGTMPTLSSHINEQLIRGAHYLILPMRLRKDLVGIILLDQLPVNGPLSPSSLFSLEQLSTHAGVALGSVKLCIERAQRTAIAEERNRISAELHDNVSQALYGLAYGLDACAQMAETEADLQMMLQKLHTTVTETQQQVRQAIFDIQAVEMSSDTFVASLHRHLRTVSPLETIALRIDLPGDFDRWEATIRRHLQQVAQEALSNIAKHANADQIIVRLSHYQDRVELRIADDGEGFDPDSLDMDTYRFGITGMRERIKALNGTFEIDSAWGEGTLIVAQVPHPLLKGMPHLEAEPG